MMKSAFLLIATFLILTVQLRAQQGPGLPGAVAEEAGVPSTMVPAPLANVTFEQRLNQPLPLDARYRDETGRTVVLGDYFGRRPVVLAFVYYQCPMLCTQVMNGVSSALSVVPFTPGQDFDVVFISFDPRDTPQGAAEKKKALLADYRQTATAAGWHFLSGDEASIRQVTSAAGFSYRWDEATRQFAHVSGVLITSADGRLSQSFYGIEYSPKEVRLALVESAGGKIGSAVDKLLLYCYHYNPATGRYGAIAMNLVRLGGVVTLICLGGFVFLMRRRESARL